MKLNRNKKILIGLLCLGLGFVLYKYFGNVVEGFKINKINMIETSSVKSPQALAVVTAVNNVIANIQGYTPNTKPDKYGIINTVNKLPPEDIIVIKKAWKDLNAELKQT